MNLRFLLILPVFIWLTAHATEESFQEKFSQQVLSKYSEQLPGYAVAIITPETEFIITHGVRQLGQGELIDENTVFRLASVSKTFTPSTFLLTGGDLDAPISHMLPDIKLSREDYQRNLTPRHLLSQTSGLVPHAYTNLAQADVPYSKIIERLNDVNFVCAPGKCYGYQNVVYSLIGDAISNAADITYQDSVIDTIFKALNMHSASFGLDKLKSNANHALPHAWNKTSNAWEVISHFNKYYDLAPAAGANASIKDMQQWLKAQLGQFPKVINTQHLNTLHTPHIKTTRKNAHLQRESWDGVSDTHYALGWRTFTFKGQKGFVHHGGWVKGFRVEMVLNRELEIGMVFMTNSEPAIASDIVPEFIDLFLADYTDKEL